MTERIIHPLIQERAEEMRRLCKKYNVRRLFIFGSATTPEFEPARSDLDFLVSFGSLRPGTHADTYFGLLADLQKLFDRPIDLVMESAVDNPYMDEEIKRTRRELYAA